LQHKKLNMTTSKKGKPHGGETWELVAGEWQFYEWLVGVIAGEGRLWLGKKMIELGFHSILSLFSGHVDPFFFLFFFFSDSLLSFSREFSLPFLFLNFLHLTSLPPYFGLYVVFIFRFLNSFHLFFLKILYF
jgi:hypothetical protein